MVTKDQLKEDDNSFVCHYTSKETALEKILPKKELRFSPFGRSNDPRENKMRVDIFGSGNKLDIGPSEISSYILNYFKLLCLTESEKENPHDLNTNRSFGKPRMWAQYGEYHRGVALIFKKEKLTKAIKQTFQDDCENIFLGSVQYDDSKKLFEQESRTFTYSKSRNNVSEKEALVEYLEQYNKALFFRKDSDWQAESEWRYVIHKSQEGYEFVDIEKAICAIIVGAEFPCVYLSALEEISSSLNIPYFKLGWNSFEEDFFLGS